MSIVQLSKKDFEVALQPIIVDRKLINELHQYCLNHTKNILALTGLRRTGKTILMMRQALNLINNSKKVLYLLCDTTTTQSDLFKIVFAAVEDNCEVIFIDEVTYIDGFADWADWIYNNTICKGIHCVIAGTDSYGLVLASNHVLFDRMQFVRTTHISYAESYRINKASLSNYIRTGGLFGVLDIVDYTNTSITNNIIASMRRYSELPTTQKGRGFG